ncbi:MAG: YlxR family protein [Caldilinea sp.]|nr:YlxR family protein [Anaerolineales bacterium]HRA67159.1 YlxR family protein [Caldilinea sp.]
MVQQTQGGRVKHTPIRTCIGCRQTEGKRTFLRVVRTTQGVVVDPTGKLAGRGAYIHRSPACWEAAMKGSRLEQALRTKLTAEERTLLAAFGETLDAVGGE